MAKYRKKPVVVEAVQFTENTKDQVLNWIEGNKAADFDDNGNPILKIQTIHGETAVARLEDWIVKGEQPGDYWPVKPDIFEQTYEKVED